jgi:hypothetical protein
MVRVLASSVLDRGFEARSSKTKTMVFVAPPLSTEALRRNSNDWLARNQNNVSEWSEMSTCGLLFQ